MASRYEKRLFKDGESLDFTSPKKVLNHGLVRLIDFQGTDLSIVRSARVSYDGHRETGQDLGADYKLINYLWKNGHTSPFESASITFEVKAPIFVFRQWHRHRTQSYNEVSARYKELSEEWYLPDSSKITTQHSDNKQMRTDEVNPHSESIRMLIQAQNRGAFKTYKDLLDKGCPRELARSVLPTGTYSHMFATANLLNWFRFLELRLHAHAQYEIRVYAEMILEILENLFPASVIAFNNKRGINA